MTSPQAGASRLWATPQPMALNAIAAAGGMKRSSSSRNAAMINVSTSGAKMTRSATIPGPATSKLGRPAAGNSHCASTASRMLTGKASSQPTPIALNGCRGSVSAAGSLNT